MSCFKRSGFRFLTTTCCIVFAATFLSATLTEAVGQTFTGGGDGFSWNDDSNWDGGVVPGSPGDDNPFVEITNQPDVQINAPTTLDTTSGSEELSVSVTDSILSVNAPSQLDAVIGVNWIRSTLNVNADLNSRATVNGGVLNLNSGIFSGSLSLGSADSAGGGGFPPFPFPPIGGGGSDPAVVNRNGGTLNLESLSVSSGDSALGVIDVLGSDAIAEATAGDNGVLNVNGAAITSGLDANAGGTANINSGTVSGVHEINGGTLSLNGGTLTGQLSLRNFDQDTNPSGDDPTFTRSGGTLDLLTLDATGNVAVDINAGDNVRGGLQTREGAQVTINSDLTLERLVNSNNGFTNGSLIAEQGSTVFLNADILDSELVQYQGNSLQRASGVSIRTQTLTISSADYTYDGTDSIDGSINITDGDLNVTADPATANPMDVAIGADSATVSINAESTLLNLGGAGQSTIDINQATDVSNVVSVSAGSVLNVNADLQAGNVNGTMVRGGTINLNDSTLRGRLQLLDGTAGGGDSTLNRDAGSTLELFGLWIEDGNHLDLLADDSVSSGIALQEGSSLDTFTSLDLDNFVSVFGGSTLNVFQSDGQLDGLAARQLDLDGSSTLNLNFDDVLAAEDELDFGLRLIGDVVDELESSIANGQLTFTGPESASIGVIRDVSSFGDFTYVGYIGVSAVPESNGLILLGIVSLAGMTKRRRS